VPGTQLAFFLDRFVGISWYWWERYLSRLGNLSEFMRVLKGTFSKWYNKQYKVFLAQDVGKRGKRKTGARKMRGGIGAMAVSMP
jgi:hypothetical protein